MTVPGTTERSPRHGRVKRWWPRRRYQLLLTLYAEWEEVQGKIHNWHQVDPITVERGRYFFRRNAERYGHLIVREFFSARHKLYKYEITLK